MGTWVQSTAQRWLVLELTNSPFHVGILGAVAGLPIMLFAFYGGLLADRLPRISFLLRVHLVIFSQALLLGLLVDLEVISFNQILVLSFILGCGMAFEVPARQSLLYDLTGPEEITNALALHSSVFNLARFSGPAIAGVIMAAGHTAYCFYFKALSATVIILVLLRIKKMHPEYNRGVDPIQKSVKKDYSFLHTVNYIKSVPVLFRTFLIALMFGILLLPYSILLPSFGRDVLGLGAREYGFLGAANGLGALAGAIFVAFRGSKENREMWWWTGATLFPVTTLLFSFAATYFQALFFLFISGFVMVLTSTSAISLLQINVKDHMRGRLMGFFSTCFMGFFPMGSLLQGWIAGFAGVRLTIQASSLFALSVVLVTIFMYLKEKSQKLKII